MTSHLNSSSSPVDDPISIKKLLEQQQILGKIVQKICQSLNLSDILNTAVTEVRQFLQADRVVIYRFHPNWCGEVIAEAVEEPWMPTLGSVITDPCIEKNWVEIYKRGEVKTIADIHNSNINACHIELLKQYQVQANMVMPISISEQLWGLLIVHQCAAPRQWQEFEANLMQQLANQVGIAITQTQLTQELESLVQQRTAELQQSLQEKAESEFKFRVLAEKERLLSSITQRIRRSLKLTEILNLTVTEIRQWLQNDRAIFYRLNSDWSGIVVAESVDISCKPMLERRIFDDRFAEEYIQVYVDGRIYSVEDIANSNLTQCHIDLLTEFDIQSILVIPIVYGKTLWGLLSIHQCRSPRNWQSSEIDFLQKLVAQVTIAIQQSLLVEQLETELAARRQAETELRRSAISRTLVGEILRDLQKLGNLSEGAMFQAGQELATRMKAETLDEFLETFALMGLGTLTLVEVIGKRWKFKGDKLVEVRVKSESPTCHYARGFLCGALIQKLGEPIKVAAVEMTCQSMADECCHFIVQVVEN